MIERNASDDAVDAEASQAARSAFASRRIESFTGRRAKLLTELEGRMRAAKAGSGEIDAMLWWLFEADPERCSPADEDAWDRDPTGETRLPGAIMRADDPASGERLTLTVSYGGGPIPPLSTSVEAADALVRLWGGTWTHEKDGRVHVTMNPRAGGLTTASEDGLALGICRALLNAVECWLAFSGRDVRLLAGMNVKKPRRPPRHHGSRKAR